MVLYCRSVHFQGFQHAKDSQAFYEMSSLKESKAFSLVDTSSEGPPSMSCSSQTPSMSCSSYTPSMSYSSQTPSMSYSSQTPSMSCSSQTPPCPACPAFPACPVLSSRTLYLTFYLPLHLPLGLWLHLQGVCSLTVCSATGTAFLHHNMDKLTRIYPAGSRTDSSNYNPMSMWNTGCQIGTETSTRPAQLVY